MPCSRSRRLRTLARHPGDEPRCPCASRRPTRGPALYPDELKYTAEHEWVQVTGDGGTVRVGITSYAQDALGDVVFVTLPPVGEVVATGAALGEVESTKSVSDVYAPLAGTVSAVNAALDAHPELVNSDPYGEGWLVEVALEGGAGALQDERLLDSAAYQALLH